jgi:hypothetical protein
MVFARISSICGRDGKKKPRPWLLLQPADRGRVDSEGARHIRQCFIVRDHNGHALAYVYFEDEPGRRAAAHLLTRDEARRIAVNIAKLRDLLSKPAQ